ncbi:MAG: helix-turn-helix transcriptional regulator [Tenericutes bacterium]|nr:helix-turn-helix transcriptional regulator [Mycoplasmatota bacterium]
MPISIHLDEILKKQKITSKELCSIISITEANLSILRSGKAKAIRFETLEKICQALGCSPGDILKYEEGDNNEMDD